MPPAGGGDVTNSKIACSNLLSQTGLSSVMLELKKLPDEQPLHVFLPDICRSRYDVNDIKGHILPLLKPLFAGQEEEEEVAKALRKKQQQQQQAAGKDKDKKRSRDSEAGEAPSKKSKA